MRGARAKAERRVAHGDRFYFVCKHCLEGAPIVLHVEPQHVPGGARRQQDYAGSMACEACSERNKRVNGSPDPRNNPERKDIVAETFYTCAHCVQAQREAAEARLQAAIQ